MSEHPERGGARQDEGGSPVPEGSVPELPTETPEPLSTDPVTETAPSLNERAESRPPESPDAVEPSLAKEPAAADEGSNEQAADAEVLAQSRKYTRRSFAIAAAAVAGTYGLYRSVADSQGEQMLPWPLRRALLANASLSRTTFHDRALAPTYPLSRAENLRVNGIYGLKRTLVPESWRLQLVGVEGAPQNARYTPDVTAWQYRYTEAATREDAGHDTKVDPNMTSIKMAPESMQDKAARDELRTGRMPRGREEAGESHSGADPGTPGLLLTIDDLLRLPRRELVTQFKCIEGWSQIVHWAGVRMADLIEAFPPEKIAGREPRFVYMETPDGDYYTGYDLEIMRHPQTLLVTEMMGEPLTQFHGAPLRLHMPTKYGYKQIKRIGLISYTDRKPDDYWTKLGYDWYAGL